MAQSTEVSMREAALRSGQQQQFPDSYVLHKTSKHGGGGAGKLLVLWPVKGLDTIPKLLENPSFL